jgi:hypothetical protein
MQIVVQYHQRSWWIVHTWPKERVWIPKKSHQRSWWIVHTWPKERVWISKKSHQRSWWIVHTWPKERVWIPKIPPTKLVDRSYLAYKRAGLDSENPTKEVGGLFIPGLQKSGFGFR